MRHRPSKWPSWASDSWRAVDDLRKKKTLQIDLVQVSHSIRKETRSGSNFRVQFYVFRFLDLIRLLEQPISFQNQI